MLPAAPDAAGERGAWQSQGENRQPEGSGCAKTVSMSANKDIQYQIIYIYSLSSAARASLAGQLPSPEPQPGWEACRGRVHPALSWLRTPGGTGAQQPSRAPGGMRLFESAASPKTGPWGRAHSCLSFPSSLAHLQELLPRARGMLRWDARRDAAVGCSEGCSRTPAGAGNASQCWERPGSLHPRGRTPRFRCRTAFSLVITPDAETYIVRKAYGTGS